MPIAIVRGTIDRRILVNFRVDPNVLRELLPEPFRAKLVHGFGMAGVCLIRLKHVRPRFLPSALGICSENAAHRIAVEWDENGEHREGVFIPRRDTSSRLNTLAGGRLFPGVHHHARFDVHEEGDCYSVALTSDDSQTHLAVEGRVADKLPTGSAFGSLQQASEFFQAGSLGFSVTSEPGTFDGLELRCRNWSLVPFAVEQVKSSYFDDSDVFPAGSVEFDSAFLMRNIEHEWHGRESLASDAEKVRLAC